MAHTNLSPGYFISKKASLTSHGKWLSQSFPWMPVASQPDIHRILNENIGRFSSRRNYLIFAKNDIAKEPSADTVLFLSFFPSPFPFLFSFFLFPLLLLFPRLLASPPAGRGYLVPPKGGGERGGLTYTQVKRKNPREREREETRSAKDSKGRRHGKSHKSEIRLKIILPFRWYAPHNAAQTATVHSAPNKPERWVDFIAINLQYGPIHGRATTGFTVPFWSTNAKRILSTVLPIVCSNREPILWFIHCPELWNEMFSFPSN